MYVSSAQWSWVRIPMLALFLSSFFSSVNLESLKSLFNCDDLIFIFMFLFPQIIFISCFFYCCCFVLKSVKHRQHWLTIMAPCKAQAILVNMVDSNIVTGQSDQVDLHHQSSLNSIKWVCPLIIITSSSTAGRLISGFVCFFILSLSFANESKKYCKEKMPYIVLTASHTECVLKTFFFFFF